MKIRVVRTDGTVEHDWVLLSKMSLMSADPDSKVPVGKDGFEKWPRKRMFDCWQAGGMCRSTAEHDETCEREEGTR
jgi:hypothetical protein